MAPLPLPPSTEAAASGGEGGGNGKKSTTPSKKPSPWCKKLLAKLDGLADASSAESQQTVASWIVFNRKKRAEFADAFARAAAKESPSSSRSLLLLKVAHRVLASNSPESSTAAPLPDGSDAAAVAASAADLWEKSGELRSALAESVLEQLLGAVAHRHGGGGGEIDERAIQQVEDMINLWKRPADALGGPTIWEGIRRGWKQALQTAAEEVKQRPDEEEPQRRDEIREGAAPVATDDPPPPPPAGPPSKADGSEKADDAGNVASEGQSAADSTQSVKRSTEDSEERSDIAGPAADPAAADGKLESPEIEEEKEPRGEGVADADTNANRSAAKDLGDGNDNAKREEPVDNGGEEIDFEAEGVEQGKVEPTEFLDACKAVLSIQITRDLRSDASTSISSALSHLPPEVEEACDKAWRRRAEGGGEGAFASAGDDALNPTLLSSLPDEIIDLDLDEARRSLAAYGETIRKQRAARLECVRLLLRSRCDFGSGDAAGAFHAMTAALEKLRDRKEQLSDAMALEGLDVDPDPKEEEREAELDGRLEELRWYRPDGNTGEDDTKGNGNGETEDEAPAAKKAKVVA